MITITTPDTRAIQREIQESLAKLTSDKFVTVGIHEDTGIHPDAGITNAQLGAVQHFGNDDIPSRPWLDVGVETGNADYLATIEKAVKDGTDIDQALRDVGVTAVGKAQMYMTQLSSPANAPSTVARKGSSNPLIDKGELRASVNYKIQSTEPEEGIE